MNPNIHIKLKLDKLWIYDIYIIYTHTQNSNNLNHWASISVPHVGPFIGSPVSFSYGINQRIFLSFFLSFDLNMEIKEEKKRGFWWGHACCFCVCVNCYVCFCSYTCLMTCWKTLWTSGVHVQSYLKPFL